MPVISPDQLPEISINGRSYTLEWELHQEQIESIFCRNTSAMFEACCQSTLSDTTEALGAAIRKVLDSDKRVKDALYQRRNRLNVQSHASGDDAHWPNPLKPEVKSYTIDQLRKWGILLGSGEIIFSWPKQYKKDGTDDVVLHQSCFNDRNITPLDAHAFNAKKHLSGRVIANVIKVFNDVILLSLKHYDHASIHAIYDGLDSLLRVSYVQEYVRQLPRNLHFEFDTEEEMYIVQCYTDSTTQTDEESTFWKIVLPIKREIFGDRLAHPPLRYYPSGSEGCDPPCAEADNK